MKQIYRAVRREHYYIVETYNFNFNEICVCIFLTHLRFKWDFVNNFNFKKYYLVDDKTLNTTSQNLN